MQNMTYFSSKDVLQRALKKCELSGDFLGINFTRPKNSRNLGITVRATLPEEAQKINKAVIAEACRLYNENALQIYRKMLKKTRGDLDFTKNEMADWSMRRGNGDAVKDLAMINCAVGRVNHLELQISVLEEEIMALESPFGILEQPSFEDVPVTPRKGMIIVLAFLLGILVGSVIIIGRAKYRELNYNTKAIAA